MFEEDISPEKQIFVSMFQELFTLLSKLHRIGEDLLIVANSEITHSCWTILSIINCENRPLTVPQIAEFRFTSRQAVQRQISFLLEYGYIKAVENPQNKRSPLYVTTPEGTAYYKKLGQEVYGNWLTEIATNMGAAKGEQMLKSIRELDDAINSISFKKSEQSKQG